MIKTKLIVAVLLGSGLAATAQQTTIRLSGVLAKKDADSIFVTNNSGFRRSIALSKEGKFNAVLKAVPAGFYTVREIGNLYLEPGYDVQVVFSSDKGYRFSGKGALENNLIREVKTAASSFLAVNADGPAYKLYEVPPATYISAVNGYNAKVKEMVSAVKSAAFKKVVIGDANAYTRNISSSYGLYYGVDSAKQIAFYKALEHPEAMKQMNVDSTLKAMYKVRLTSEEKSQLDSLSNRDFSLNDEALFRNSSEYRIALGNVITKLSYSIKYSNKTFDPNQVRGLVDVAIVEGTFTNPFIKSSLKYQKIGAIIKQGQNAAVIDSLYHNFNSNPENKAFKKELAVVYSNYKNFGDQAQAPLFNYEQVSGEKVSLESLRGKYVYIDVWATWCGPCKREIPFLGEIEEKYKGKNIHFVSLSVDVEKDKQKWKKFVEDEHLKGIQLIADQAFDSDFIKKFNINSIPRFILIDPKGKIVSANAKRPSDPELQKQLDLLL